MNSDYNVVEWYHYASKNITWRDISIYTAIGSGTWLTYKLFIKPFLSPLRQIPGAPYKPIVGNMFDALKSEAMSNTIDWMQKYKSRIIRFYYMYGEGRVLIADPELVRYVTVTNSKNYGRLKSTSTSIFNQAAKFVLFSDGDEHHALRKVMNHAFNLDAIESFIPTFCRLTDQVVDMWNKNIEDNGGKYAKVEAQMIVSRLTLDLICECGFDYHLDALGNPSTAGVLSFRRILQDNKIRLMQMLPFFRSLPTRANRQLWADNQIFKSTIADVMTKKRAQLQNTKLGHKTEHKGDLLSILFQASDEDGNSLSDDLIFDQIAGFLFAGFETTSTLLTWTLLLLSENPEAQEKLRSEVTSVWSSSDDALTGQLLDKMTYLTCVIKESLRLFPPISVVFRQAVKDDYLGGYFIPAGTPVGISIGALHRLPENWEDPELFKPERFLKQFDPYKFFPFMMGPYMCIGRRFSMTESKTILATLIKEFSFTKVPGYTYRRVRYLTVQPHPPLVLHISKV